jgi:hypothetical protein
MWNNMQDKSFVAWIEVKIKPEVNSMDQITKAKGSGFKLAEKYSSRAQEIYRRL